MLYLLQYKQNIITEWLHFSWLVIKDMQDKRGKQKEESLKLKKEMEIDNLENSQPSKFAKYAQIKIVAFRKTYWEMFNHSVPL